MFFMGAVANARLKNAVVDPGGGNYSRSTMLAATTFAITFSSSGATGYLPICGGQRYDATETPTLTRIPVAGVLRNMQVYVRTNARTTTTTIFLRKNGADSATVKVLVPPGVTGWVDSGWASETIAAGDDVAVRVLCGSGSGGFEIDNIVTEFKADDKATCLFTNARNSSVLFGDTNLYYMPLEGFGRNTLLGLGQTRLPAESRLWGTGSLHSARLRVGTNTSDGVLTVKLLKDNVYTGMSFVVPAGTTGFFDATGGPISVAPGDSFTWSVQQVGRTTGSMNMGRCVIAFTSDDGVWDLHGEVVDGTNPSESNGGSPAWLKYSIGAGRMNPTGENAGEANRQLRIPFPVRVQGLQGRGYYNNVGGVAVDVYARKNGANAALLYTMPSGGNDSTKLRGTGDVALAADDLLGVGWLGNSFSGPYGSGYTFYGDEFVDPIQPLMTPMWSGTDQTEITTQAFSPGNYYVRLGGYLAPATGGGTVAYNSEGDWRSEVSADGEISGLSLYITFNNRGEASTFSLMVNGVASTRQFITIPAGTTGWVTSLGLAQPVSKGDLLSLRMNFVSGDFGSIRFSNAEAGFTGSVAAGTVIHHHLTGYYNYTEGAADTNVYGAPVSGIGQGNGFGGAWGGAPSGGTIADWASTILTAGTTGRMRLHIPTNTSTVGVNFTLFKNGVATAMTLTVPASTTGVFTAEQSVALAPGDKIEWRRWGAGTGTGSYQIGNLQLSISSVSAYDILAARPSNQTLQGYNGADYYLSPCMWLPITTANAGFTRFRMPQAGIVSEIAVRAQNGSAGTTPWDHTLMKNGVATTALVTVPATSGAHNLTDAAHPITFAAGDRLNFKFRTDVLAQTPYSFTMRVVLP